jgi:hypothetical protein
MNDSEPYDIARAVDSDDDRPVGELTESDVEMLRCIFSGRRDPMVHEFSDLIQIRRLQKDVMMSCRKLQRLVLAWRLRRGGFLMTSLH